MTVTNIYVIYGFATDNLNFILKYMDEEWLKEYNELLAKKDEIPEEELHRLTEDPFMSPHELIENVSIMCLPHDSQDQYDCKYVIGVFNDVGKCAIAELSKYILETDDDREDYATLKKEFEDQTFRVFATGNDCGCCS